MAAVMNALYDDALETKNQATLLKAAMIAEKLAPYVHPRLSSITQITEERRVYVASLPDAPQTTQEWADKYEGDTDAVEEEE